MNTTVWYCVKFIISAALIVSVSEIARNYRTMGALLASLPLVSVLAMIWLYIEGESTEKISAFSLDVFWLVIPSLLLFLVLPAALKYGMPFPLALIAGCGVTSAAYLLLLKFIQG